MSRRFIVVLAALVWLGAATTAKAGPILFEWAVNQDGVVSSSPLPANWNDAAFDFASGLGTLAVTITGPGTHGVFLFLDIEIDEETNTFFNEVGTISGTPAADQSWEIDEPGFVSGDIYENFLNGALDNSVGTTNPDDVSVALGWNFVLAAGQSALVTFHVTDVMPQGGFYLGQPDPDSPAGIYFPPNLIVGDETIPEPATLLLLGTGLLMLGARVKPRR